MADFSTWDRATLNAWAAGYGAEMEELADQRDRLAKLLTDTAIAMRGPEPELTKWGWDDLPERAAQMRRDAGQLVAKDMALEQLRKANVFLERELAALKRGEFICSKCGLRKDADRPAGEPAF